ncbi:hypothetical protein KSP40_PGU019359 [Platanthera guangdongensis]|uniref:FLZ-type domain-containing protein n=1 Tax=Platanthera guangdongensis TaxID=2320717 RepID=A0ABR2LJ72_9ASPA
MLLGKRQRRDLKRTTSMTEFAVDFEVSDEQRRPPDQEISPNLAVVSQPHPATMDPPWGPESWPAEWFPAMATSVASWVSPRANPRRNSLHFTAPETAPFLRSCGLCNRRLAPGRDIFMYRGETAYCSFECRQQQINQDEEQKCSLSSMKDSSPATTSLPESSGAGESVAAA